MEIENLNIGLAFIAGLVSFISPCVLPLVPAYVGYMGGMATAEAGKANRHKFGTFLHGVFFVLGFTIFFVGFGLLTAAAASFLDTIGIDIPTLLTRLGGVAVILFGLYIMKALDPIFRFVLRVTDAWEEEENSTTPLLFTLLMVVVLLGYFFWAFGAEGLQSLVWALIFLLLLAALFRNPLQNATSLANFWNQAFMSIQIALISDTRRQVDLQQRKNSGYMGSLGLGIVFSAGWTPCIGPVYGAVLALANDAAAGSGSLLPAASLLTAYSLGLGIPFLLTALAFNQSTALMTRLKRNMGLIERFSGALLILIGVLILSGSLTSLSAQLAADGELADFSFRLEECTVGVIDGRIGSGDYTECIGDGYEKLTDRYIAAVNAEKVSLYIFPLEGNSDDIEVGLSVGNRAPDFTIETLNGDIVSLKDFEGQAVLVNFWATWCGPCRAEMPDINQVYGLVNHRGFVVLAIDFQESADQVQGFVDEFGLNFPVGLDTAGAVNRQYRVAQYPTSYLIDGNGIIRLVHTGPLTSSDLFDALEAFEPVTNETLAIIG
ncbi:MAG: redoxin domain-containing protein [Anaerolineales bacterium]|nr:redoxin domain-containing protein [Anaerolineales bacterium]